MTKKAFLPTSVKAYTNKARRQLKDTKEKSQ